MVVTVLMGSLASYLLLAWMRNFTEFIDFITIASFLVAPIIAYLNHRAMFGRSVATGVRPGRVVQIWSWFGIAFLVGVSMAYLVGRILSG